MHRQLLASLTTATLLFAGAVATAAQQGTGTAESGAPIPDSTSTPDVTPNPEPFFFKNRGFGTDE